MYISETPYTAFISVTVESVNNGHQMDWPL